MTELDSTHSHRHDNRTELEKLLHRGKPWFEENGTLLIYALAAVLAIAAVIVYVQRKPAGNIEASQQLLMALTPEDFRDVADAYPETEIGVWARLRQADRLLDNAVSNMFTNRELGLEELDQAESAYKRLAERSDIEDTVRERVLIGLARLAETRCDGKSESTEQAIAAWKRVIDEFPESLVKDHAAERIEHLATDESKAFYAWFSQQNPKPVDPGMEPGQPGVPNVPLNFPGLEGLNTGDAAPETESGSSDAKTPAAEQGTEPEARPESSDESATSTEQPKPATEDQPGTTDEQATDKQASPDKSAEQAGTPAADQTTDETKSDQPAPDQPKADEPAGDGGASEK
ncbi:MAG: hypothetical protein RIK87_21820 [Fuerstiella sp.]